MNETDLEFLCERVAALEAFIVDFLPPIIAGSGTRAQLEAQLQALADLETSSADDPELHWKATLAEDVLSRLQAG